MSSSIIFSAFGAGKLESSYRLDKVVHEKLNKSLDLKSVFICMDIPCYLVTKAVLVPTDSSMGQQRYDNVPNIVLKATNVPPFILVSMKHLVFYVKDFKKSPVLENLCLERLENYNIDFCLDFNTC